MAPTSLKTRIIAVGGGKGGVGKSTISARLGMCMGTHKNKTLLVDADFAASNLHTLCGIPHPLATVNDFLNDPCLSLEKVMVPVNEYTWLLSGAGTLLSLYGPTFKQRERLFRALNALQFDAIIVDVPAGTGREIIDFFSVAYHRIIVIEPTPLSVENAYLFLKNIVYRRLFRLVHLNPEGKSLVKAVMEHKSTEVKNISSLLKMLTHYKPGKIERLHIENQRCRYWLLVNKANGGTALSIEANFCAVAKEHLGLTIHPLVIIEEDQSVVRSLFSKEPLRQFYSDTPFNRSIEEAVRILKSD